MSQNNTPTYAGGSQVEAGRTSDVSHADLELDCINLIAQLETQIESAKSGSGHVEKASENTDKILNALLHFSEEHFEGERFDRAVASIEKASYASLAHREVLNTRSWGFAIKNLLGKSADSDASVRQTYEKLGDATIETCVTVLREVALLVGPETDCGKTIEQSTAVFVEEFRANW